MPVLLAVAAILIDRDQRILIAQRPEGKIMPGFWEFPGGKVEAGETPESALKREVEEELGIELKAVTPFTFISEARSDYHLVVLLYFCREWQGKPQSREGQEMAWVHSSQLDSYNLLPANKPLVALLEDWFKNTLCG